MIKKVAVLTLNYNGKSLLKECIDSYLENDYEHFDMIVIDNGSSDGSQEYVKKCYPGVKLIENGENLGYSRGFNEGLRFAFEKHHYEYALITNNDVKADPNVIKELVKVAEMSPDIGFVTGKVLFYDQPNMIQTVGFYEDDLKWNGGHIGNREIDNQQFDTIEERAFSDDIFILVKKTVYYMTKGYDPEFKFQAEQFDWQIRSKKAGFKIFYTPFAKIWHKDSITIGKASPFKAYYDTRNSLIVRLKHRKPDYNKRYFKYYLKYVVLKPFLRALFHLQFKLARNITAGFLSAMTWSIKEKKIKKFF